MPLGVVSEVLCRAGSPPWPSVAPAVGVPVGPAGPVSVADASAWPFWGAALLLLSGVCVSECV